MSGLNPRLILWIVNFLVNLSQTVCHQAALLSSPHCFHQLHSRALPDCFHQLSTSIVLSPLLFALYTDDCTGTATTPIIKYSDDSAMEDLSNSDSVYFVEVVKVQ